MEGESYKYNAKHIVCDFSNYKHKSFLRSRRILFCLAECCAAELFRVNAVLARKLYAASYISVFPLRML